MAAERISKLQKFILTAAYEKTELRRRLRYVPAGLEISETPEISKIRKKWYLSGLYEDEILQNYYKLDPAVTHIGKQRYESGANKERTTVRRSVETLEARGYINIRYGRRYEEYQYTQRYENLKDYGKMKSGFLVYDCSYYITLTAAGKDLAEKIIEIS